MGLDSGYTLPSQSGHKYKVLSTDGLNALWTPGGYNITTRLSLQSGVRVHTADRTAQSTLYIQPGLCVVNAGSGFVYNARLDTEIAIALSGLTSGKNYDVFALASSSDDRVITYAIGPAWTSDTVRSAAVSYASGLLVNTASFTPHVQGNAGTTVAAGQGVLLGTFRATGATTTECSVSKRFLSNLYCQEELELRKQLSDTHTYASNPVTVRQWNGNTANKVEFVSCYPLRRVKGQIVVVGKGDVSTAYNGMGLDATTQLEGGTTIVLAYDQKCGNVYTWVPQIGYHYISINELNGVAGAAATYYEYTLGAWIWG